MIQERGERATLVMIAAVTLGGFLLWLVALLAAWLLLRAWLGITAGFWEMTAALSTAAAVTAVIAGGYVAYRELSEVAITRHIEVADRLFAELNSAENIAARRWVFQNLDGDPAEIVPALSPEGRAAIKRVLNSLDRVAFLTQAGWIPEEMIMPWMNPMVAKAWIRLRPFVEYESARRGERDYYTSVQMLGERCLAWRAENLPGATIIWLDDAL